MVMSIALVAGMCGMSERSQLADIAKQYFEEKGAKQMGNDLNQIKRQIQKPETVLNRHSRRSQARRACFCDKKSGEEMIIDISDCSTTHHPLRKKIVVDPGHGGKDPGAVANGLIEKNLNLEFSLELTKALEQAYYAVELTRSDDTFIRLSKRRDFLPGVALFLSVHHNSSANKKANGVEVYYRPDSVGSKKVAELLSAEISSTCGLRNRGARSGKFTVLQRKNPSVLIELGFISNPGEASVIRTEGFVRLAVKAILHVLHAIEC